MKRLIITIIIVLLLAIPVHAVEFQAPQVPDSGKAYMPDDTESFSAGLWSIVKEGIAQIRPSIASAAGVCLSVIVSVVISSIVKTLPGSSAKMVALIGALLIGYLLLKPSDTLINLGSETIRELSDYGKMLFPVLTAVLAANGGVTKSAALYTGAVAFNSILSSVIASIMIPMIYIYLCVAVSSAAIREKVLETVKNFIKWLITWTLKIVLYVFTGFMGITGIITGSADAAAIKATKLTISGVVPVVGGILSDASETVLVSAGIVKSSVGVYGLLAVIAVWIGPFLKIGIQYLLLKLTCVICETFSIDHSCKLIQDFATAMGLLLAMTGTICLLLLISIVCFMKGVAQ